jgi:hypothetical protein
VKRILFTIVVLVMGLMGVSSTAATAADAGVRGSYAFTTSWGLDGLSYCLGSSCHLEHTWEFDGHVEAFAIGTNQKVFRARENVFSWTSMDGCAIGGLKVYEWHGYPTVEVLGCDTPTHRWCSSYDNNKWQKFHLCAGALTRES